MTKQRKHEAPEIGAMIRRMVRALVRRAAEGDWEALEELQALEKMVPVAITEAGRSMHDEFEYSYTVLGNVLGVSRQAARQRFAVEPTTDPTIR